MPGVPVTVTDDEVVVVVEVVLVLVVVIAGLVVLVVIVGIVVLVVEVVGPLGKPTECIHLDVSQTIITRCAHCQ